MLKRTQLLNNLYKLFKLHIEILLAANNKAWAKKGQVFAEYALILALVIGAITVMKLYLQRGLQGRYKAAADYATRIITADDPEAPNQFDPYYVNRENTTSFDSSITRSLDDGQSTLTVDNDESRGTGWSYTPPYSD